MATFTDEASAFIAGFGRPTSLIAALRDASLSVPLDVSGRYFTTMFDGMPWMIAFTSPEGLRRYAEDTDRDIDSVTYVEIVGADLIDTVLDVAPEPTGLLVDPGTDRAMTLPPVRSFTPHRHVDDDTDGRTDHGEEVGGWSN